MKAAIVEGKDQLVVREVAEPSPGDYEALCEILYGATCSGTDSHLLGLHAPFCHWVKVPFILGHESVGRVVKVGCKVRNFRVGDLVTRVGAPGGGGVDSGWGGFSELGIARDHWAMAADGRPAKEWSGSRWNQLVLAAVNPRVAPMFTTWRESASYLLRMGVGAGASVLVAGSGGNGLSFAVVAKLLGASRVVMVGSARREAAARAKGGVDVFLDYDRKDLAEALRQAAGDGFDFAIDSLGKSQMPALLAPALKAGGVYGNYGMDDCGKIAFPLGVARGRVVLHSCEYDEAETHQRVSEWLLQGRLDASLWYDPQAPYPLEAITDAFSALRQRKSPKVLVRMRGND